METVVFIGILGVSAGVFGLLTLSGLGCYLGTGDSLLSFVNLACPI